MSHPITEAELEAWRHLPLEQWSHAALRAEVERLQKQCRQATLNAETTVLQVMHEAQLRSQSVECWNTAAREIVEAVATTFADDGYGCCAYCHVEQATLHATECRVIKARTLLGEGARP